MEKFPHSVEKPGAEKKEHRGFLQRFGSLPGIRPMVLTLMLESGLGGAAGAYGGWKIGNEIGEKLQEYTEQTKTAETSQQKIHNEGAKELSPELKAKAEAIAQEINRFENIAKEYKTKIENLKKEFGDHLPERLDPERVIAKLGDERRALEQYNAEPKFFEHIKAAEHPENKPEYQTTISPFEGTVEKTKIEFSGAEMKEIIAGIFPEHWVQSEFESIKQLQKVVVVDKAYGLPEEKFDVVAAKYFSPHLNNPAGPAQAEFYWTAFPRGVPKFPDFPNTLKDIGHEIGHGNDWDQGEMLQPAQRIDLLQDVARRLHEKDRFRSTYVESIQDKKDGAHKRYLKATEYWGEICAAYFTSPGDLNVKDYQLVDRVVRITDPEFKKDASESAVQEAITNAYTKALQKNPVLAPPFPEDGEYSGVY